MAFQAQNQAILKHGGDLAEAARLFPDAPQPWIDLSTGINPNAYPLPPLQPGTFARLPGPADLARLEALAAARYGVAPERLLASAGTHPVLAALPRLFEPQRVAIFLPTYAEHARAWSVGGHVICEVASLGNVGDEAIAVLVRPNNPTGEIAPYDKMASLQRTLGSRGGLLLIDEAFADFLPRAETALALPSLNNTLILRSFGKTYGLAGIRLSFAIGEPPLIERLRAELGPWPVSSPALAIGTAAFLDSNWLASAKQHMQARSEWLENALRQAGIGIRGGTPFFILIEDHRAAALFEHFGRAGLFTRRFAGYPNWLRLGMPTGDTATLDRVRQSINSFAG